MDEKTTNQPTPEVLQAPTDDPVETSPEATPSNGAPKKSRRSTYRPSHKATFVGVAVVVAILAVNVGVIAFLLRDTGTGDSGTRSEVTLSTETLDSLGVSKNPVGTRGTELVVGPNARFNGKVVVGSDITVAGQLTLNNKLTVGDAGIARLEAGNVSIQQLGVNGDGTLTNLNVRQNLAVGGATRLQGPTTFSQLVTINNSLNVSGNLAIGGVLSARAFQASSLTSDTTLTIGGHIVTRGAAPSFSPGGSALGSNGTASNSGSDAAGTVAANVGVGATSGIVGTITFRIPYGASPRVVVTAVGAGARNVYVNRSATGFSIGVNDAMPPGGYAFDYIVIQ